jgi:hypothetical protein
MLFRSVHIGREVLHAAKHRVKLSPWLGLEWVDVYVGFPKMQGRKREVQSYQRTMRAQELLGFALYQRSCSWPFESGSGHNPESTKLSEALERRPGIIR